MKTPEMPKYPEGIDALIQTLGECDACVRELKNEGITVYQDGARVKKSARIGLKAGRNRILIVPVSPYVHADSLEASVEDKGVRISAASYQTAFYTALPEEALREERKDAEEKIASLEAEIAALKEEKSMLEVLMKNTEGLKSREEIAGIMTLYHENGTEIREKIRETEKALEEEKKRLEEVLQKIEKGQTGDRQTGIVEIIADAETDREIELRIAYTDWAAGWNLNYMIRVDDGKEKASVSLIANVHQNTEEAWKNVSLVFSSGAARSSLSRPVFTPERIGLPVQPKAKFNRLTAAKMSMAMADEAVDMEATVEGGAMFGMNGAGMAAAVPLPEEAKASENGNVIEFALSMPEDIESGKIREILLSETELPAEQIYECYPKVSPSVWLSAKITETGKLPALDGNCRVFHNGAFAGSTWLSPEASEDGLTISLGTDEQIRVSRKDAGRSTEKGFLGSGRKNYYNYELHVQNLKARAVELLLIDQLPVAAKETIKVEATELSGAEVAGKGTEEGKVTWKLKLEPGSKVQKKFSYKITYKE